ncbi:MAG: sulfotransferase [Candidatus Thorarchaeota archaeon]
MQRITKITEQTLTGTNISNWFTLLWENKFKIGWRYFPRVLFISLITLLTAPFALYEKIRYGRKIRKTEIQHPPVFIIGHWRSGTTYLHSLMIQDTKFAYVSNMVAFMPSYFISSGGIFKHILKKLLPAKRRMDNITLGLNEPQEEEYAIANLSNLSLYHGMAFPQNFRHYSKYCSMEGLPKKTIQRWKKIFVDFLKKITFFSNGKQLILKNPSNTFRVKLLLELFPNAKFIHIYRNPYEVFLSTWKMYSEMFPYFFLQDPFSEEEGKELILDLYEEMFERYFEEKMFIPKENLIEIKYEDMVDNPIEGLNEIYNKLQLGNFDEIKDNFISYLNTTKNYKRNEHQIDENLKLKINERWHATIEKWGYNRIEKVAKRIERIGSRRIRRN